jgi:coenzyme F420-reducing hydrogenase gamma subunit
MRFIAMGLIILLSCTGCRFMPLNAHEKKVKKLGEEIEVLRKEIRRERLTNTLEELEEN